MKIILCTLNDVIFKFAYGVIRRVQITCRKTFLKSLVQCSNKRYLFKNLMYERNLKYMFYMACFFDRGVLRYQEQNKSNNRLHTLFIVHYLEKKNNPKLFTVTNRTNDITGLK